MSDYVSQTIDVYNAIASSYAKQALQHGPGIQRRHFCSLIPKRGKILDVGCGSGRDCAYFVKKGFETVGVDLSDKLLEIAQKEVAKATFLKQDIRNLSFPPNFFDGIWSCASLLHIKHKDIPETLRSWFSVPKPSGILFIHVKKVHVKQGEEEVEREDLSVPGVKRLFSLFSKEQLRMYCEQAGFIVITCDEILSTSFDKNDERSIRVDCWAKKI